MNLRDPQALIEAKTPLKLIAGSVDIATERGIVLHLAKNAISVVTRTTSGTCVKSQMVTQGGQNGPMEMENVPIDVRYMRLASVKMTWMT